MIEVRRCYGLNYAKIFNININNGAAGNKLFRRKANAFDSDDSGDASYSSESLSDAERSRVSPAFDDGSVVGGRAPSTSPTMQVNILPCIRYVYNHVLVPLSFGIVPIIMLSVF